MFESCSSRRAPNHSTEILFVSLCFASLVLHPFIKRNAFQILFEKFLPCSQYASSNGRSFPAGEHSSIPTRTPSAPYFSISSIGSGEFPSDLLILRPILSRTIPVR